MKLNRPTHRPPWKRASLALIGAVSAVVLAFFTGVGTAVAQSDWASDLTFRYFGSVFGVDLSTASFSLPYSGAEITGWPTAYEVVASLNVVPLESTHYWYAQRKNGEHGWHVSLEPCTPVDKVLKCDALYLGAKKASASSYQLQIWKADAAADRALRRFVKRHEADGATTSLPQGATATDDITVYRK